MTYFACVLVVFPFVLFLSAFEPRPLVWEICHIIPKHAPLPLFHTRARVVFIRLCPSPRRPRQQRKVTSQPGRCPSQPPTIVTRSPTTRPAAKSQPHGSAHAINYYARSTLTTPTLCTPRTSIKLLLHVSTVSPTLLYLQNTASPATTQQRWLQRLTASASCPRTHASAW